jgi:hypothetical protein
MDLRSSFPFRSRKDRSRSLLATTSSAAIILVQSPTQKKENRLWLKH